MTLDGRIFGWLSDKDQSYVKRRTKRIPVYSASGLIMNAYRVKNTRRMRKLGAR